MKKIILPYLCLFSLPALSQDAESSIRKGNDYYIQKQYVKAAEEYNRAIELEPGNTTAKFNLGNAFYKQDNKVDAAEIFNGLTNTLKDKGLLSKVFYNKGVILSQQKNLE